MNAVWPLVTMALGLIAVLYAVWPIWRGRAEPSGPAAAFDPVEIGKLVAELERWSVMAGESAARPEALDAEAGGEGARAGEVTGPRGAGETE